MAVAKDPRQLETAEPFVSLFPIIPDELAIITRSMRERGYIKDKPILAWRDAFGDKDRHVVVDGHSRRLAALDVGLKEVTVTLRRYNSVDEALLEAVEEQAGRRNFTRSQIVMYVLGALAKLDTGSRGQGSRNDLVGRSAQQLADMLGVGRATIERARKLITFGDDALLAQVKAGEIGLKAAVERGQREDRVMSKATAPPPEPEPEPKARTVDTPGGRTITTPKGGFNVHIPDHPDEAPAPAAAPSRNRPRPGERVRKGVRERVRQAEDALRLLWWEFESELPADLDAAADAVHRGFVIDGFESMVDADSTLAYMLDAMRGLVTDARGGANLLRKIEAMRNTAGRTPAEAALFEAKADQLEADAS